MTDATLEVTLEGAAGSIPARVFLDIMRGSLDLLQQLERADPETRGRPGEWLIADLRIGSAAAVVARPDAGDLQSPSRLLDGVQQLRRNEGLPAFFSEAMVRTLAMMGGKALHGGLGGMSFGVSAADGTRGRTEHVGDDVVAHAFASVTAAERAIGSVVGILDVVNLRRGSRQVSLYNDETRRAVRCRFGTDLFDAVKAALGTRVRALGEITRNRRGQILSVDIERLEGLAEDRSVPSVDDLAGIATWYTGDLSTEEYLRSVRGA